MVSSICLLKRRDCSYKFPYKQTRGLHNKGGFLFSIFQDFFNLSWSFSKPALPSKNHDIEFLLLLISSLPLPCLVLSFSFFNPFVFLLLLGFICHLLLFYVYGAS